jgi:hypothetical protein
MKWGSHSTRNDSVASSTGPKATANKWFPSSKKNSKDQSRTHLPQIEATAQPSDRVVDAYCTSKLSCGHNATAQKTVIKQLVVRT